MAPSESPAGASPSAAAASASLGATVMVAPVGSAGQLLVAGSNGMTLYNFSTDVANSGTSACTGACLAKWPALTVPAGTVPSGDTALTGTLSTITRADDGTLQVTYNGLPLYFYSGDKAPGDANGNYPGWAPVKP